VALHCCYLPQDVSDVMQWLIVVYGGFFGGYFSSSHTFLFFGVRCLVSLYICVCAA
jgi:hypothetical protein